MRFISTNIALVNSKRRAIPTNRLVIKMVTLAALEDELRSGATESKMRDYQKLVCGDVVMRLQANYPQAPEVWINMNWEAKFVHRRLSLRHHSPTIKFVRATPPLLSDVLAWMRTEPFSSPFVFHIRSLITACVKGELFGVQTDAGWLVGYIRISFTDDDALAGTMILNPKKKKKLTRVLWVDLFEIFTPYHRYGFGRLAIQQLPSIGQDADCVQLESLPSAEPFWLAMGFKQAHQDSHFCKKLHPFHNKSKKRINRF